MNSRSLLIALTSIGLALMAWHLRWVLLVLFGAVVVAVALDVLITQLMTRTRLNRPPVSLYTSPSPRDPE